MATKKSGPGESSEEWDLAGKWLPYAELIGAPAARNREVV